MRPLVVAIDGPAGSGKSTTARYLAGRLGYLYLDSGAMYRALSLALLRLGLTESDEDALQQALGRTVIDVELDNRGNRILLDGEDVSRAIRDPDVGAWASRFSTVPSVRGKITAEQRRIASGLLDRGIGVVVEGRDIGTVVFPDAAVKVFMQADDRIRAERRLAQLAEAGVERTLDDVLAEIRERDARDRTRAVAPLRQAPDAVVVDTSRLTFEDQVRHIAALVRERAAEPISAPAADSADTHSK